EKLYVNAYGSIFGRGEINLHGGHAVGKKWHSGYFAHASGMFGEIDQNKDGFRDIPMGKNLSFMNRWNYQGKRMEAQFGVNSYYENKEGGQTGYRRGDNSGKYGVDIESKHIDVFAKTGFLF